jgi:hypothetical protein
MQRRVLLLTMRDISFTESAFLTSSINSRRSDLAMLLRKTSIVAALGRRAGLLRWQRREA